MAHYLTAPKVIDHYFRERPEGSRLRLEESVEHGPGETLTRRALYIFDGTAYRLATGSPILGANESYYPDEVAAIVTERELLFRVGAPE